MKIEKTSLPGVFVITPLVFSDNRGYFSESYNMKKLKEQGIDIQFVQDNHSLSTEIGTLRGIHFQNPPMAQTKLVRCSRGKVLDIAIDLRKDSPTFKEYVAVELSEDNFKQLFIPKGFGHAFLTLTDDVEIQYKVDEYYSKEHDRTIIYNDSELDIKWPKMDCILSEKDKFAGHLKDVDIKF